uniref:Uncharacterized protein n=1 Tax=viral metagenome TaxID=1070528 RepID=A0A6C0KYS1_9ZZZZ
MLGQKNRVIHERGIPIPITKKLSTHSKNIFETLDYDLNKNIFDPTNNSPPNDFLVKLKKRMEMFENFENIEISN